MAVNPDPKWKDELLGSDNPDRKRNRPAQKRHRRDSAKSKPFTDKRLNRSIPHNEVCLRNLRWDVICFKSKLRKGKSIINAHITSFKCEACDVPFSMASRFKFFRLYHSVEHLQHTPHKSRSYRVTERGSSSSFNNIADTATSRVINEYSNNYHKEQGQETPIEVRSVHG